MRAIRAVAAMFLVMVWSMPARADFQYSEISQVTGGALVSMMKFASVFSKDAKQQQQQALSPQTTTRYVCSDAMRVDRPDGTIQIIDLAGRRVIEIDPASKSYSLATFDQIKAAMEQAAQQAQQQAQRGQPAAANPSPQNPNVTMTPQFHVTPLGPGKMILNTPTNETKIDFALVMTAQDTSQAQNSGAQGNAGAAPNAGPQSASVGMNMDTFLAPSVTGYKEFTDFYRRLGKEINWTPPAFVHLDARFNQGITELQKDPDALKGLPMLSYVSMTMAATGQQATQNQNTSQNGSAQKSSAQSSNTSASSSDSTSTALGKAIGGRLFGKKNSSPSPDDSQGASSNQNGSAPNGKGTPGSLLEVTIQVTSYSASALDKSTFAIPTGYTQVQKDPLLLLEQGQSQGQAPARSH
jgi:hypothetical protein